MLRLFLGLFSFLTITRAEPLLSLRSTGGSHLEATWSAAEPDYRLEQTASLSPFVEWMPVDVAPAAREGLFIVPLEAGAVAQFFRLIQVERTGIESTSPYDGEVDVAVTRESIIRFSAPLEPDALLNAQNLYAISAGRRILSRAEVSADRRQLTLFYLEPLPGGARVNVFLDPEDLFDFQGRPLDPAGFGEDHNILSFSTLSLTPLAQTAVVGTVYAAEFGANGANAPLAGVTITVDGMEQSLRAVTDSNGNFKLAPVPAGKFFVHIDGRTLANDAAGIRYPDKSYYPFVGKAWEATAGREDNLAGGTGKIYLPLIVAGTLQPVSQTVPTTVSLPAGVVAVNPALSGVTITVPANSLFSDNGTRGGKVGIAPVPPDRLPGPLPAGLILPIVITVQTDGPLNFDQPAPVCFPNVTDPVLGTPLPAGSKQSLVSFNHKKGVWEAVGTMTVSADGKLVCTDPGSGILQPGWHGVGRDPDKPPLPTCADVGAASSFASFAPGRIIALQTEAQCSANCKTTKDQEEVSAKAVLIDNLGVCTLNRPNHKCELIESMIAVYQKDLALIDLRYHSCLKRCKVPRMQTPKRPKKCRPKNKSSSTSWETRRIHATAQNGSAETVQKIEEIIDQIQNVAAPYVGSAEAWPAAVEKQITDLYASADVLAGGNAAAYIRNYYLEAEIRAAAAGTLNEPDGNAPEYPVLYMAEILRPSGSFIIRGETEAFGQYQIFTPRDGNILSVRFYDPQTRSYGIVYPRLRPDAPWRLPSFELFPLDETVTDSDGDGLADVVELVYGTDPRNGDSDGDGNPDGAEAEQGTNPLDGRVVQTGIVGTTKTPGSALDVAAANGLIVTAEGQGVSIFNPYNGESPVIQAHVLTPGDAQRVATDGQYIAAAAGDAGLLLIDATDPARAYVTHQLGLTGASAVASAGGVAFVGTAGGVIAAVDMRSGWLLNQISLNVTINDLAVLGEYVYAVSDQGLHAVLVTNRTLSARGFAVSPFRGGPNLRVIAGGGVAYVVHGKAYNTFDLADPANPVLIKAGDSTEFGWRHMAVTGSGLALVAAGPNSTDDGRPDVSLYDVRSLTNDIAFLTTFPTPGTARAVALWEGLSYIADSAAGLQVVNYLAYDNKGVGPKITLTPSSALSTGQSIENAAARVTANASDDTDIRHVEFYLNGELIESDGAFPFEFRFSAPRLALALTSFGVRAKATDTGGNFTWSEELIITLLPDSTAPEVTRILPRKLAAGIQSVSVFFNEKIDPASLTASTLSVFGAGTDGLVGTADDLALAGGVLSMISDNTGATLAFPSKLPVGPYRIRVGTGFADHRGNHLTSEVHRDFEVVDAVYWTNPAGGAWGEPRNWSTGRLPGPTDDVLITTSDPARIVHSQGETSIRSLRSESALLVSGGRLEIKGILQVNEALVLNGGTLVSARILQGETDSATVRLNNGFLDGVTLNADLSLEDSEHPIVKNGLTVNRTLNMVSRRSSAILAFQGPQTLGGTGQVVFAGTSANHFLQPDSALTLGPGLTIRGAGAIIGHPNVPLINAGTIIAEVAAQTIRLQGKPFSNTGTVEAINGGLIAFDGEWNNTGTMRSTDSILNLGGVFSTAAVGNVVRTGGEINLVGVLNNTNATFAPNASLGSVTLAGGTIQGGNIAVGPGGLRLKSGILDGVTVESDLTLQSGDQVRVKNGLTINKTVRLASTGGAATGFHFQGTPQTLGGSGEIVFADTGMGGFNFLYQDSALTIASGFKISGASAIIGLPSALLENRGTILAEVPGRTINLRGKPFLNRGTVTAANGAVLTFDTDWENAGTFQFTGSTINLGGTFTTEGIGVFQRTGGVVTLTGTLDNTNAKLAMNSGFGPWTLEGGTIRGGGIASADGTELRLKSGILDGVTLDLNLTLQNADSIRIRNGLTIQKRVTLTSAPSATGFSFEGAQTLGGAGEILFTGLGNFNYLLPNAPLTLAAGFTIHGSSGIIGVPGVALHNAGTIAADVPEGLIQIKATPFQNTGVLREENGGKLLIIP